MPPTSAYQYDPLPIPMRGNEPSDAKAASFDWQSYRSP